MWKERLMYEVEFKTKTNAIYYHIGKVKVEAPNKHTAIDKAFKNVCRDFKAECIEFVGIKRVTS